MASLNVVQVQWTNLPGGGLTTLVYDATLGVPLTTIRTFFEAIKSYLSSAVTLVYPGVGPVIDEASGMTTGTWTATPPASTLCTGSGGFDASAGAVVTWHTGQYVDGRELRGRTFLVPLSAGNYDTGGFVGSAVCTAIQTAAAGLHGATNPLGIYRRPSDGSSGGSAHAGVWKAVTSASVPRQAAVLRSRRP